MDLDEDHLTATNTDRFLKSVITKEFLWIKIMMTCFVLKSTLTFISVGAVKLFGSKLLLNVNTCLTLLDLEPAVPSETVEVLAPGFLAEGSKYSALESHWGLFEEG